MNKFIYSSFDDADLILLVIDLKDQYEEGDAFIEVVKKQPVPKIIVLNKMDLLKEEEIEEAKKSCGRQRYRKVATMKQESHSEFAC